MGTKSHNLQDSSLFPVLMAGALGSIAGGAQKKEKKNDNRPGAFMNGHSMETRAGQEERSEYL